MEKTQPETAALVIRRIMPFPPDVLFRAFSDPKIMSRWFFTWAGGSAEVAGDFREGGAFSIGMRPARGEAVPHHGIYREIVPGEKIVFSWNSPYAKDSVVTLLFRKVKDGTELTLTHEFLAGDQRQNHEEGWKGCLDNLALFLQAGGR